MKLINTFCVIVTLLVGVTAFKFVQPLILSEGSAVIYAMTNDGKRESKPFTVKLPNNITSEQLELLAFAYQVAKSDGYKHPQYLQGILMQESNAGNMDKFRVAGLETRVGDRYFGIGQIKLVAAKAVMNRFPEMWRYLDTKTDEELQARLILDDKFNIRIASKYALLMGINDDPTRAITAYNRGPGGVNLVDPNTHEYTQRVKTHTQRLKNVPQARSDLQSFSDVPSRIVVASSEK